MEHQRGLYLGRIQHREEPPVRTTRARQRRNLVSPYETYYADRQLQGKQGVHYLVGV